MDPLDFLKIAKKLTKYDSESNWRTSIGRSYYAVFLFLRDAFKKHNISIPANSLSHVKLQQYLSGSDIVEAMDISSKIGDLHTHRLISDYHVDKVISQDTAKLLYKKALKIKTDFSTLDIEKLKEGIENYKSRIEG